MQGLRLGGHPLHPALVHFPVACWTAAPVLDVLGLMGYGQPWWQAAFWCIATGAVTALAAMTAGLLDLVAMPAEHPAQAVAMRHMLLMTSAWCVFCVDLLLRPLHAEPTRMQGWLGLGLSLAGFLLLLTGAHAGARLVYDLGVGQTRAAGR